MNKREKRLIVAALLRAIDWTDADIESNLGPKHLRRFVPEYRRAKAKKETRIRGRFDELLKRLVSELLH